MSTQASATTPNYGLSQWAEGDRIWREDFNHDNAAIDAALHTQAAQTAAAVAAVEENLCQVRLFSQTLSAGTEGLTIDLSAIDLGKYVELELILSDLTTTGGSGREVRLTVNGDNGSSSYYSGNSKLLAYVGLAYGGDSYRGQCQAKLMSGASCLPIRSAHYSAGSPYANASDSRDSGWAKGSLADVKRLYVFCYYGKIAAGTSIVLYGLRK